MLPDSLELDTLELVPIYEGIKGVENLTSEISLIEKNICPPSLDQGKKNYCVAYACSYGAFSIEKATPRNPFSAPFIYKRININKGTQITRVLNFMRDSGVCQISFFPDSLEKFPIYHKEIIKAIQEAQRPQNRPLYNNIWKPTIKGDAVRIIKKYIAQKHPVIIGVRVEKDFRTRYFNKSMWTPSNTVDSHAMVIVGYNDTRNNGVFEIMNSYGKSWGKNGFIDVKYEDLQKELVCAFVLTTSSKYKNIGVDSTNNGEPEAIYDENIVNITIKNYEGITNDGLHIFKNINSIKKINPNSYYIKVTPGWAPIFQLELYNMPKGKFLYALSLDSLEDINIHWPPNITWSKQDTIIRNYYAPNFGNTSASSILALEDVNIIIPSPSKGLKVKYRDLDQFVILISDEEILSFKQQIKSMDDLKGKNIQQRVQQILGDKLIDVESLNYFNGEIIVKKRQPIKYGSIVPIFLIIDNRF